MVMLESACEDAGDELELLARRVDATLAGVGWSGGVSGQLLGVAHAVRTQAGEVRAAVRAARFDEDVSQFLDGWVHAPLNPWHPDHTAKDSAFMVAGGVMGLGTRTAQEVLQRWWLTIPGRLEGTRHIPHRVVPHAVARDAGRWLKRGGPVLAVGTATVGQAVDDWNNETLTGSQKVARGGAAAVLEGGGGLVGGALTGAAVGSFAGPVGAVVGGLIGGAIGAGIGGKVKDWLFDLNPGEVFGP